MLLGKIIIAIFFKPLLPNKTLQAYLKLKDPKIIKG